MNAEKIKKKILDNVKPVVRETAVPVDGPCWEWQGGVARGYGHVWVDGKSRKAHRIAFSIFNQPIPEGMYVLHRCDNRACCNPAHLFLGTHTDNARDRERKGRGRNQQGSKNVGAKLTESDIPEIFKLRSEKKTQQSIADAFGVTRELITLILLRKIWKHVKV